MDHPAGGRALSAGLDATVVLLRHGESTAIAERRFQGRANVPLSPIGRREAELAATRLARPHAPPALPIPAGPPLEIVTSPLERAARTAEAVAAAVSAPEAFGRPIPVRHDAGLVEISQGEWEGLLASEIEERWPDLVSAWRVRPTEARAPGGESLDEVRARVRPTLRMLQDRLADGRPPGRADGQHILYGSRVAETDQPWSIVVAHEGVFKVALLTLLDLPLEAFWIFPFALCGISIVEFGGGRPRLRAHNLTDHLAPVLEARAQALAAERERAGAL